MTLCEPSLEYPTEAVVQNLISSSPDVELIPGNTRGLHCLEGCDIAFSDNQKAGKSCENHLKHEITLQNENVLTLANPFWFPASTLAKKFRYPASKAVSVNLYAVSSS